jgi:hypothetical protein
MSVERMVGFEGVSTYTMRHSVPSTSSLAISASIASAPSPAWKQWVVIPMEGSTCSIR